MCSRLCQQIPAGRYTAASAETAHVARAPGPCVGPAWRHAAVLNLLCLVVTARMRGEERLAIEGSGPARDGHHGECSCAPACAAPSSRSGQSVGRASCLPSLPCADRADRHWRASRADGIAPGQHACLTVSALSCGQGRSSAWPKHHGISLTVEVGQIDESACGKECASYETNGSFDPPLVFPRYTATGRGSKR